MDPTPATATQCASHFRVSVADAIGLPLRLPHRAVIRMQPVVEHPAKNRFRVSPRVLAHGAMVTQNSQCSSDWAHGIFVHAGSPAGSTILPLQLFTDACSPPPVSSHSVPLFRWERSRLSCDLTAIGARCRRTCCILGRMPAASQGHSPWEILLRHLSSFPPAHWIHAGCCDGRFGQRPALQKAWARALDKPPDR